MRGRWRLWLPIWLLIFLIAAGLPGSVGAEELYVQDQAGIISPEVARRINQLGASLEAATPGAQVVVMTVPSLDGKPISQVAVEEFRRLGIGSQEKNNGVLFLVAPNEREVRIEVGYGLEGAIPDGKAGRILDEEVIPYFQAGDFDRGIENGYRRLVEEVAKEYNVTDLATQPQPADGPVGSNRDKYLIYGIAVLLLLDVLFNRARITRLLMEMLFYAAIFGRRGGGGGFGGGGGGFGGGSSGGGGAERRW